MFTLAVAWVRARKLYWSGHMCQGMEHANWMGMQAGPTCLDCLVLAVELGLEHSHMTIATQHARMDSAHD